MRPQSRFEVNSERPRARGVCDRCGQHWQHNRLEWQFQWVGPRLQNLRILVCPECLDKPQPNIRTIVIPPDPVPVMNARPENYVQDDNPLSAIGVSARFNNPQFGNRIGSMTGAGGLNSAFDGVLNKQAWQSATNKTISDSSYNNYVGINWQGNVANTNIPSSLQYPVLKHSLLAVTIQAPRDRSFLGSVATSYVVQCSPVDTTAFSAWSTIASGTTAGIAGETISLTITSTFNNPTSQFHRVAFLGDGVNYTAVAQVQFSVAETKGT